MATDCLTERGSLSHSRLRCTEGQDNPGAYLAFRLLRLRPPRSGSSAVSRCARSLLAEPTDIASLAAFRILFGSLLALAMVRFLARGWVTEFYVQPRFYFYYPGFKWVHPWPAFWMHVHFIALCLLAVGVALGAFYRACIALFFLGFVYVELIDQVNYLNHYYLISLLAGLMIFVPANRAWSIDAWRNPDKRQESVPAWTVNLLRFQVAIVYIFAGLAKINPDWLLHAQPLRIWLAARSDLPLLGPLLSQTWVAYAASWFGAIFDTTIVFFLVYRKTRKPAFFILIAFHLATWLLFNIGIFPWVMIASVTLLFPPDWPRRWMRSAELYSAVSPIFNRLAPNKTATHLIPRLSRKYFGVTANGEAARQTCSPPPNPNYLSRMASPWLKAGLCLYAAVQLALPLRSYLEQQPVGWTCDGFNCAWRVMIVEKTGYAEFYAVDPTKGVTWKIPLDRYLTPRQELLMAQDPYLIREMAHYLRGQLEAGGFPGVQIRVNAVATLNGRPGQLLVNPKTDLANASGSGWIVPLRN